MDSSFLASSSLVTKWGLMVQLLQCDAHQRTNTERPSYFICITAEKQREIAANQVIPLIPSVHNTTLNIRFYLSIKFGKNVIVHREFRS